jgi:glutamate synthase (NADPH) large chain
VQAHDRAPRRLLTGSELGQRVLARLGSARAQVRQGHAQGLQAHAAGLQGSREEGLSGEEAVMAAFEMNKNDVARVSGN